MAAKTRFEELLLPLRGAAFNLAYWILQSREEAEDVVQEAYLRAFRAFPRFQGDSVRPWLLAIVRNSAYTALAARKRSGSVVQLTDDLRARKGSGVHDVASTDPSPEMIMISEVDRQQLLSALSELPLIYRDVLVLREMETMAYAEIADVIGAPIGTVMSRLSRGRAELRKAVLRRRAEDEKDAVH
jgi:RNA polymerase sigma-70 factor (ECF subfamily)